MGRRVLRPSSTINPLERIVLRRLAAAGAVGAVLSLTVLAAVPASADLNPTATVTTCGGVTFIGALPRASFGITLDGTAQAPAPAAMAFDVSDCSGLGNGWNLTAQQATTDNFVTAGPHTLQSTAGNAIGTVVDLTRPVATCDGGVVCTPAVAGPGPVTYPGTTFGVAAGNKIYQAAPGSGMGNQTVVLSIGIGTLLANNYAGLYTATWVVSLVSGP